MCVIFDITDILRYHRYPDHHHLPLPVEGRPLLAWALLVDRLSQSLSIPPVKDDKQIHVNIHKHILCL